LPSDEWAFAQVALSEDAGAAPDAHFPVAVLPTTGALPNVVEINTRRNAGSQLAKDLTAIEITALTVNAYGLVPGTLTSESLMEDSNNDDPYDDLTDGVFYVTESVPAGSKRLLAEIIASTAPDIDLFLGHDDNGDGMPQEGEELCRSTTPSWNEYCELTDYPEGIYWVLVQNWSGSADQPDDVVLATAVVPGVDSGNMTVEGPTNVPALEPFDVRLYWDIPTLAAGERWYGAFDLGSDADNPGNIGTVNVNLIRHEDDVVKTVNMTKAMPGETLTFEITIQPNVTPEDLTYTVEDTIPAGLTYVEGSATGGATVVDGVLTWSGTMPTPVGATGNYVVSTSATDPLCDTGFGGYINLEDYGILTQAAITGDTVAFTAFSSGDPFNYWGDEYTGMSFTDDGFAIFDPVSNYGGTPWVPQAIPNSDVPNNVLAVFWHDFEIFYDAGLNHGVSLATAGAPGGWVIVEYDDIQLWGGSPSIMDFEIIVSRAVNDAPGAYEIVYAYDNISSVPVPATIGVEDATGANAVSLVSQGDAAGVISNGFMVCFDLVGAMDPVVITYQATVDADASGILTNNVVHNTDNPGSQEASTSVDVEVVQPTIYISPRTRGRVGGVGFRDEDILAYDTATGDWSMYFDGSDVGLRWNAVNAFAFLEDGSILMSLNRNQRIAGLGRVQDSDILRFIPTSLGADTAGSFEWYFDGSDVGLRAGKEDVDAIGFTPDGRLVVSTARSFRVPGLFGRDEDLIVFNDTSLGKSTSGTWEMYFDGSDVGLNSFTENIWGTWIDSDTGKIYLTTRGRFSVEGVGGDGADIFACTPDSLGTTTSCTFAMFWNGSAHGFAGEKVHAFTIEE
jgi:uncharacterized repeat protein (TIGR01451 family)